MKTWMIFLALLAMVAAGLAIGRYSQAEGQWIGDLKIGLTTIPDPPQPGKNTLRARMTTHSGMALSEARVVFYYFERPLHYQIPQERPVVEVEGSLEEEGVYSVIANLDKAGPWKVAVKIYRDGDSAVRADPLIVWFTVEVEGETD